MTWHLASPSLSIHHRTSPPPPLRPNPRRRDKSSKPTRSPYRRTSIHPSPCRASFPAPSSPRWPPLPHLSCISHSSPPLDLSSSLQHRAGHRSSSRSPLSLSIFHRWSSQLPPLQGAVMSPARHCLLHFARITIQSTVVRPQSRHCHLRSCHSDVVHVIRPSSPMWPADLIPSPSSEGL